MTVWPVFQNFYRKNPLVGLSVAGSTLSFTAKVVFMRLSGYRYFLNLYWAARVHLFLNRVGVPAIGYSNTPSSFGFRVFFFFCRFCRLMELAKLSFIRRRSRFSYRRRGVFR